jgi:MscS family membrane protein
MILRLPFAALMRALCAFLVLTVAASAQVVPSGSAQVGPPASESSGEKAAPAKNADSLGRSTPQGLVKGLMSAFASRDYERAEKYFETSSADVKGKPRRLASQFHEILDRVGTVTTPTEMSLSPEGNQNDGLAEDLDQFGTIQADDKEIPLLAKRVEREGSKIWLVSADTLSEMATLPGPNVRNPPEQPLLNRIPEGPIVGGAPLSHWLALLFVAAISFAVATGLVMLRGRAFRLLTRKHDQNRLSRFVDASAMPLRFIIAAGLFIALIGSQTLGLSVLARYHGVYVAQFIAGIGLTWLIWRIADVVSVYALDQMSRRGQVAAYSVVSFLKRFVQAAIAVAFVFVLIRSLGIDVTTALAALGLGGLAVALGAQKLFENLIGSLTLVADRPVRVGDFCRFGSALGTVEDIGIRSTRIRTLGRTIVTVPNGEFASMQIENYTSRDRFWFNHALNLRYETSPEQVRYLLQELRAMLLAHPRVSPDPARVRFISLGAHSIDLEIFAYVHAHSYDEYLEVQEDLLLRCMDVVKQSGTGFAFPSQTLYVTRDDGIDKAKARNAEDAVRDWQQNGSLQSHRFDSDVVRTLREPAVHPLGGAAISGKGNGKANGKRANGP